jgi:hypothetical protein
LRVCPEDTWAECPTSPNWLAVPVSGDGFGLRAASRHFSPENLFGGYRPSVQVREMLRVRGTFGTFGWPEVMSLLLGMALDRDSAGGLCSYCMDYYTPADPRRYLGVIVDRLHLAASGVEAEGHGATGGDVVLRLDLRAKTEDAHPTLDEEDFDYSGLSPTPFAFDGAAVSVSGAPVTDVEAFAVETDNHLADGPNRPGLIAFLASGRRSVSLELRSLDNTDAFNEAIRDDAALSFAATFAHADGHTLTLSLPVLHPVSNSETALPGRLAKSSVRMEAAADGEGNDITYAVNLAT